MTLQKLQFRPGINRDLTNYSNEGGWFECDKVRFLNGYPEKLNGWATYAPSSILGTCRAMFGWITSFEDNLLAMGTSSKVYIEVGTNLNDVTPLRDSPSATMTIHAFSATNTSAIIAVEATAHGTNTGDFVTFSGASSLGGNITADVLNQNYEITKIDDNNYNVTASVTANASDTASGGVNIEGAYEIPIGNGTLTYGYGWTTSTWARLGWGSGSLQPVILPLTIWFFDNFDNDVVMNINTGGKGKIYYWERGVLTDPGPSLGTRAVKLSTRDGAKNVPAEVGQIMVSQSDRHLLAFGATPFSGLVTEEDTGTFDPLLIRFADQDNPEDFKPTTTNSAGFLRVSSGSRIVGAFRTRQETLVFTDMSVHSLQFLGTTEVFSLQELETNISICSPRCIAVASNVLFWMGTDKFYLYNGRVDTLPCSLRDHVFNDLNFNALTYVYAGTIEAHNEIWWFYPSKDSDTNDSYVTYNYKDNLWFYGKLNRSAWLDANLRQFPQAVGENTLFDHENGVDADGSAMESFITSSDFDIGDGDKFTLVRRIIPDIDFTGSNAAEPRVKMTVKPRDFPGSVYRIEDDANVIETSVGVYTDQVYLRARARQIGFKITSDTLGTMWKLGSPRLDGRPDGRR
tara:strand:- start:721 stop:2604 length:1884 start_codon:yes stop_codon:yes gene_type:complete